MSYGQAIRLMPETERELAFGSITSSYTLIGSVVDNPIRLFVIQNFTDAIVMFSFDGVNDHLPLAAGGYIVIDVAANKTREQGFYLADGTGLWVKRKSGVPSTNFVSFSVFYGRGGNN